MRGAALLPVPSEAESFLEDLVQEVPVRPRLSTAEDVGPPGRGTDLPRLGQGSPPRVGDQREEGVDRVGHVSPHRLGPRVGGGLADRVDVPHLAPPVHPHGVGPADGRHPPPRG